MAKCGWAKLGRESYFDPVVGNSRVYVLTYRPPWDRALLFLRQEMTTKKASFPSSQKRCRKCVLISWLKDKSKCFKEKIREMYRKKVFSDTSLKKPFLTTQNRS